MVEILEREKELKEKNIRRIDVNLRDKSSLSYNNQKFITL